MQKPFCLLESTDLVEMQGLWHLSDCITLFLNKVNIE